MSQNPKHRVLVLNGPGDRPIELDEPLIVATREAGIHARLASSSVGPLFEFSALWVPGDLSIRSLLAENGAGDVRVAPHASAVIQAFHATGRPILAPCMALSIALESLSAVVSAEALTRAESDVDVVYYPELRLFSTNRLLIGQNNIQKVGIYSRLLGFALSQYR
jgi:hypothetical protein